MISEKYIKDLDFECLDDIFNYIIESKINGQNKQGAELIHKLSSDQFRQFWSYCVSNGIKPEYCNWIINVRG